VLVARVRAVLRRRAKQAPDASETVKIRDIEIHPGRHEVLVKGKSVRLTRTEFGILHFLARRPGWVFTRYQIVDGTQGEDAAVTDRSVDVHIVSLRRKLGPCGKEIETVRGVGYRFRDR
jgi:two-component system phosphate regulon response regulator PhoB